MAMTLEQWSARLAIASRDDLPRAMKAVTTAAALRGEREAKLRVGSGGRHTRTGRLRASITGSVVVKAGEWAISLRAGGNESGKGSVKYARLQEKGGTVRPTKSKFLAIPVGPALTAAGVSRYASPRDVPGLVVAQTRGGQLVLLMGARGKVGGKGRTVKAGEVYFLLRRQVHVPGRPYLEPAADIVKLLLPGQVAGALTEVLRGQ